MLRPYCMALMGLFCFSLLSAQSSSNASPYVEVLHPKYSQLLRVVNTPELQSEGWYNLRAPKFWQRAMQMGADSSLVNVAWTREILMEVSTKRWDKLGYSAQKRFLIETRALNRLPKTTRIYVTSGKRDFYQIEKVLPQISASIPVFEQESVSPWYAQAILLIESPGTLRASPAGAYGPFQLMPAVARQHGLRVNSRIDDRANLPKAAAGAARLIKKVCIPETKRLLARYRIPYDEEETWFKLLVLHAYHAGAGNVAKAFTVLKPRQGGMKLIKQLWNARKGGYQNASQNYSQVALAAMLELQRVVDTQCLTLEKLAQGREGLPWYVDAEE
ncbi:MAG: transglycosylase SLT domain-containing protein [Bacteroidota bacterium]